MPGIWNKLVGWDPDTAHPWSSCERNEPSLTSQTSEVLYGHPRVLAMGKATVPQPRACSLSLYPLLSSPLQLAN